MEGETQSRNDSLTPCRAARTASMERTGVGKSEKPIILTIFFVVAEHLFLCPPLKCCSAVSSPAPPASFFPLLLAFAASLFFFCNVRPRCSRPRPLLLTRRLAGATRSLRSAARRAGGCSGGRCAIAAVTPRVLLASFPALRAAAGGTSAPHLAQPPRQLGSVHALVGATSSAAPHARSSHSTRAAARSAFCRRSARSGKRAKARRGGCGSRVLRKPPRAAADAPRSAQVSEGRPDEAVPADRVHRLQGWDDAHHPRHRARGRQCVAPRRWPTSLRVLTRARALRRDEQEGAA